MNFLPSDSEQERRQKGWLHEQEMVAKYGKIHGMENARNFHLWWTKKQYEQGGYEYDVRESPAPYSNLYPDHFIQTFFSRGSESNLLYYLTNDFIGDEIDSEYIKSILITAKDYGIFTPEALVIFTGGSVITYDPPANGSKFVDVAITHNVSSSDVLVGSKLNKDKAKAIRRWLKAQAKKLYNPNSSLSITSANVLLQNNTGIVKAFAPDHAERLLAYPGSLWMKAPDGAIPTPLPPAEPKRELCYCQTHPNAKTLDELPSNCKIHATIRKHLPGIEAQIAARNIADTSAGFRSYCEGELIRHIKNVSDLTSNLAHPSLYTEIDRPQMLELKFWNLALCGLYKNELESIAPQSQKEVSGNEKLLAPAAPMAAIELAHQKIAEIDLPNFIEAYAKQVASWQPQFGDAEQVKQQLAESRSLVFNLWNSNYLDKCAKAARRTSVISHELSILARHVTSSDSPYNFISDYPYSSYNLITPVYVGEYLGKIDQFVFCFNEFQEAGIPFPPTPGRVTASITRYFPAVTLAYGDLLPDDKTALQILAVWLLHWTKDNRPESSEYSLAGQLREQQATHPEGEGFLKACRRLHKELLLQVVTEQTAKSLLTDYFTPEAFASLQDTLKWWAGWIKEQGRSPVRRYIDTLKKIPIFLNATHQWDLEARVCEDIKGLTPLRREFENAFYAGNLDQRNNILHELKRIAKFNIERITNYRELNEQGNYAIEYLVSDVREFYFPVWEDSAIIIDQVSPTFWAYMKACISTRQGEAKTILIAFGESILNESTHNIPSSPLNSKLIYTIDELCIPPFTLIDLEDLLTHLKVIELGKWHLGNLPPRNAAPKSAFPAAYRILAKKANALMRHVDDTIWADAFRKQFEAPFGSRIANYKEDSTENRPEFERYLASAQDWVDSWKKRFK